MENKESSSFYTNSVTNTGVSFSSIEKKFDETQNQLKETIQSFPWENQEAYTQWLANTYHYVLNSTRILAMGGACMPQNLTPLSNRFIVHAAEEKGHEKLLERDLKYFNLTPPEVPVTIDMQMYHQSLYYWMSPAGGHPIGLMGWILSLEGVATKLGPWAYQKAKSAFSDKATNFLRVHAEEDPDHLEKAFQALKGLPTEELKIALDSIDLYSRQYQNILKTIMESVKNNKVTSAA